MSLTKQKESLLRDRERLTAEIEELNKRVQIYQLQNDTLENKRTKYEEKCRDLYRLLDVCYLHYTGTYQYHIISFLQYVVE